MCASNACGSRVDKRDLEGNLIWSRRNASEKVGSTEGVIICGAGPLPTPVVTKLVKQALQVHCAPRETRLVDPIATESWNRAHPLLAYSARCTQWLAWPRI